MLHPPSMVHRVRSQDSAYQRFTMLLSGQKLHCHACFNARRSQTTQSAVRRVVTCSANGASKQTTIHKLIDQKGTLLIPGVHDALSAKVLAHTGHVSAFVSGYAVSNARGMQHIRRQSVRIYSKSGQFQRNACSLDLFLRRISICQHDSVVTFQPSRAGVSDPAGRTRCWTSYTS